MHDIPFIGRQEELQTLQQLTTKKTANLVVITGRRRIGKSRLIEEFSKNKAFYSFSGLPPEPKTTAQMQRNEFARQLGQECGLTGLQASDWGDLFTLLAKHTQKGQVIILLDEISWMAHKDKTFLGKLKITWDMYFKKNPKLMLVLCSSVSPWIEKNVLSSTGFFGRINHKIFLEELSLSECNLLFNKTGIKGSPIEKFMLLAVTGGIPWYIELFNPYMPALENIKRLCFEKNGVLVDEFRYIFHDLFGRRSNTCKKIVEYLAKGAAEYTDIATQLGYPSSGPLSEYLNDLILSGFIRRDFTWILKNGKGSKLSLYRLSDNYLRFYLKYIAPNLEKIKKNQFKNISISTLPGWDSIMGLQFENTVLSNRTLIYQQLGIRPEDIVSDNPYLQRQSSKQKGCQIDYLIHTKYNTLFVCEIKFSRKEIGGATIDSIKEKINRLVIPKNFACFPVLIHVNGVSEEIENSDFFSKIIDFSQLLSSIT
jgi:uncharacterized protein